MVEVERKDAQEFKRFSTVESGWVLLLLVLHFHCCITFGLAGFSVLEDLKKRERSPLRDPDPSHVGIIFLLSDLEISKWWLLMTMIVCTN